MTVIISGDTGIDTVGNNTVGNGQLIDGSVQLAKLGFTPPFTKSYTSPEQTITSAGSLTLPHLMGVEPTLLQAFLVCKTAQSGFSIGEKVFITADTQESALSRGMSIVPDATNLTIKYGSNTNVFIVINKSAGTAEVCTNANWRLVIRAWA